MGSRNVNVGGQSRRKLLLHGDAAGGLGTQHAARSQEHTLDTSGRVAVSQSVCDGRLWTLDTGHCTLHTEHRTLELAEQRPWLAT